VPTHDGNNIDLSPETTLAPTQSILVDDLNDDVTVVEDTVPPTRPTPPPQEAQTIASTQDPELDSFSVIPIVNDREEENIQVTLFTKVNKY
jgi:hypothetical protein